MSDFVNLAGKIRDLRKNLGMLQGEFAEELRVHRSKVARWESSLIKNRSTPSYDELCRLAKLAPRFWEAMFWFLDDQVPASVVVEYTTDGERRVGPDENGNPLYGVLSLARPSSEKLADIRFERLLRTEHGQKDLRDHFAKRPLPEELQKNTSDPDKKYTSFEVTIPADAYQALRQLGASNEKISNHLLKDRLKRVLAGMAPGEKVPPPEEIFKIDFRPDSKSEFLARRQNELDSFHHVLKWNLMETTGLNDIDKYFNKVASAGPIKQNVDFCDGRVLIELMIIQPATIFSFMKTHLMEAIGKLLMFERIHNKTYKKCILFTSYRAHELDPIKLRELLQDLISAAKTLGVTVEIACGATATVKAMTDFIKNS